MIRRHTIVLDEEVEKKLRHMQADQIKKTGKSVSFSAIINDTLRKAIK
ncbi:hypothetical protein [Candidatus Nitrosotenuis aquarius]|nr:hypothetical protein [Candidatus Nitrosotenuis aquarius]